MVDIDTLNMDARFSVNFWWVSLIGDNAGGGGRELEKIHWSKKKKKKS